MATERTWKTLVDKLRGATMTRCARCGLECAGDDPHATGPCPRCGCDLRPRRYVGDPEAARRRLEAAAPDLLAALRECITEDGARAMIDESRNAASIARRRLDVINDIARAAIAKAGGAS